MTVVSISELAAQQQKLERAALKKFPYDPDKCTLYMDLPYRQIFFSCLTCSPSNVLCYACGMRCHGEHKLAELHTKRKYRCDRGTSRLADTGVQCNLRRTEDDSWANADLPDCQNFLGKFCACSEHVDDISYGSGTMYQCLLGTECGEDWFHARCIAGITFEEEMERLENQQEMDIESETGTGTENNNTELNSNGSQSESESEIESEMSDDEDEEYKYSDGVEGDPNYPELPSCFGALICPACSKNYPLNGTNAVLSVVNGYTFLKEDYISIIRSQMPRLFLEFPFLAGEETYTPAKDTNVSLLEAGEEALKQLPHEKVMDGLQKFKNMEDNLKIYLQQIAKEGRVVSADDIQAFFGSL